VPGLTKSAAAIIVATAVIAGCAPSVSPTAQPSASAVGGIRISAESGIAVDRPTFEPVTVKVDGLTDGLSGGDLTPYLKQKLVWTDCEGGTRCADVLAPLDYADPASTAVTISLRLKPATKKPNLGSLFINPGGPGGSGKELVSSFQTTGLEQYDIVGWDPRGAGDSTPIRCLSDAEADAMLNLDSSPDNEAERTAAIQASYAFTKACWERNGDLLNHIGTIETVRDLDLLRQLLGDRKLNFLGYSYGTQIGATYAELFGPETGRLVLDAAVNIIDDDSIIQAQGFDLALGNFATWCAEQSCGLGSSKSEVLSSITGLFDRLDSNPLKVGSRKLTQSLAVTGVAMALYGGKDSWSPLATIVQRAINGDGSNLLYAADQLNFRDDKGHYDPMFYAFPAISCLDTKEKGILDADRIWAEDQKKAPIFGKYFGPGYSCALWPVRPSAYLQLHLTGAAAAPLVVIGGTGDNATPIQYARSMAAQLKSAVLVTYKGEGHGGYGGKSACVDKLVVDYLAKGRVPADGTVCSS
jgi:pimeloyl-ACP methyl ester carboxylesterase